MSVQTCPQSKRAFETLVGGVYKQIEDEAPGLLSVTLYNWVSPWTRGSLEVNEVALAVHDASPEQYVSLPCCDTFRLLTMDCGGVHGYL